MLFKNRQQIINNGQTLELKKARNDILDILSFAIKSVYPYNAVKSKFGEQCINFSKHIFDISCYKNIYHLQLFYHYCFFHPTERHVFRQIEENLQACVSFARVNYKQ